MHMHYHFFCPAPKIQSRKPLFIAKITPKFLSPPRSDLPLFGTDWRPCEYIMRTNYLDQILCDFYLSNNFFFLLDFSFLVVSIFFVSDYLCILRYTSISLVLFLHNIWSFLFTTCDSLGFFESSFLFVSFIDKFMKVKRISILSLLE